jgi:hypothetical protein
MGLGGAAAVRDVARVKVNVAFHRGELAMLISIASGK